jgi:hypothetical protein
MTILGRIVLTIITMLIMWIVAYHYDFALSFSILAGLIILTRG